MILAFAALALIQEPLGVGQPVAFEARRLDGSTVSAPEALRGTPTMLLLWGPWSPQSGRALEAGVKMRDRYGARLQVIALTCWDTRANTVAFLEENKSITLTAWWDPAEKSTADSIAMKVFRVKRFPSVFLLDRNARVAASFVPYKPSDDLAAAIDRLG